MGATLKWKNLLPTGSVAPNEKEGKYFLIKVISNWGVTFPLLCNAQMCDIYNLGKKKNDNIRTMVVLWTN